MVRIIKKYKNRRLYDTETSQYITIEDLQGYVMENIPFSVHDAVTNQDITNSILLHILVEMQSSTMQLFSSDLLREMIRLAHHPMNHFFKTSLDQMTSFINNNLNINQKGDE